MHQSAARKPIPLSKYANMPPFTPAPKPRPAPNRKPELEGKRSEEERQARKCDQAARVLDKREARSASLTCALKTLQKPKAAVDGR